MSQATVSTDKQAGFTEESFRTLLAKYSGPKWMRGIRSKGWEAIAAMPTAAMNHEEWRRTDIRTLKLDAFTPPVLGESTTLAAPPESFGAHLARGQFGGSMLQVNGQHASAELANELV